MKRIPVYVPEEHHEQLRVLAFKNNVSMAEEIRKAIKMYLKSVDDEMYIENYAAHLSAEYEMNSKESETK